MKRVKRSGYKQLYTSRRRRHGSGAVRAIVGVVIMAAIVFVGYSIFPVAQQLLSRKWKPTPEKTTSSAVSSSTTSSSSPTSSSSSGGSSDGSSGTSSASVVSAKVRGCFLPKSYLSNSAALKKFIAQAKDAGINLAVVDLKGEDGVVNYATNVSAAKGTQLVAQNAPDAKQVAGLLAQAGITPAARICAFKDPLAPQVIRGAGVMYSGNHTVNWLDPTNTRWLNPFSPLAQNYINGLCTEAVSLGYKQIFIDSLTFPTSGTETQSYYGENMPSKEKVLTNYVSALKAKVHAAGGTLSVVTSGQQAVGQAQTNVGQSQSIFAYAGDSVSPNLCPALFGTAIKVGSATIAKPDLTPGKTVAAAAQYLKAQNSQKIGTLLPFVQDYTDTALGSGSYKNYTAGDVKAEIAAVKVAGARGYILYNPQGSYDLSGLS